MTALRTDPSPSQEVPPMTSRQTGGELLAAQLVAEGVTTVFGVPGIQLDYAVDGIAQQGKGLDFVVARHEQGAAYMADGYARVAGKPGVCLVVPGPGLLNAGAALATAYACSSPMVLIVGQIPSPTIGRGYGMLHEIPEQSRLLRSLTKWHRLVTSPEDVPDAIAEAFQQVRSGRPRPVAVEVPPDVLKSLSDAELVPSRPVTPLAPDPEDVRQVVRLIGEAKNPVLYAGGGVRDAPSSAALQELAERLGAPVVMSRNGRGALSDRHPLAMSRLTGGPLLDRADTVIAVGTRFMTQQGRPVVHGAGRHRLIGINADPADLGEPRQYDAVLTTDAHSALTALLAALPTQARPAPDLSDLRRRSEELLREIQPQVQWLEAIRAALPDDGVLVDELTQVGYPSRIAYPVYQPGTYVTPGYQGTLGYGFPTGLGVQAADPDRPVVAITGDGGFGWCLPELATAARYELGLVTVVFVNGSFGNVERIQQDTFGRTLGVELHNPDFAGLASAYGVRHELVKTPEDLTTVIRAARGTRRPLLVEVPVGDMPSPWDLIAEPSYGEEAAR
ncbi:hypothetical protein G9U51_03045 [Calidifontibacter sp. DB0510]|uniref:Thiamine pyrophosphate-binding protein n=1 Tax=Metallococcus carri TaxID=1656884 RepID=A0A967AXW1_9MICO|nr:thiamine pyrophosphate-binding protein [Metallococcus carri]NHN54758.1 hypothetical protein [Metallococcus carri]NOP37103.1 hypothetical protein [Calidifontibacter sp. DB2511S]